MTVSSNSASYFSAPAWEIYVFFSSFPPFYSHPYKSRIGAADPNPSYLLYFLCFWNKEVTVCYSHNQFDEFGISDYWAIDKVVHSGLYPPVESVVRFVNSDSAEQIIKEALAKVTEGIPLFEMVAERIELDEMERTLVENPLLRVTFSASQDLTIGDDEDLGNIVHVSNGEPFGAIETTIENTFGLSSQITLDSKGITNTLASNMGNGIIETSVSVQSGEIKYTYRIIVADIELGSGIKTSAAILFNVYLKNSNFPPDYPNPIPVDVTDGISTVSDRFSEGAKDVAVVVGALAFAGLVVASWIYLAPLLTTAAAYLASGASAFSTILAAFAN